MPLPNPEKNETEQQSRLTAEALRQVLDYEPLTGVFRWKIKRIGRGRSDVGSIAGCKATDGNRLIGLFRGRYQEHRLAFLWMTGKWPPKIVDHKNLDRSDNRWTNLRLADFSQNGANARARGSTNLKGVTIDKSRRAKQFKAQIKVNYQMHNLGHFDTAEAAHAAYVNAAQKLFGEFARAS